MFSRESVTQWQKIVLTGALLLVGGIVVPVATWWYVPSVLWWFFRTLIQSVSAAWVLAVAVLLSLQMAVLWSLPIGVVLILLILLLWSLENVMKSRKRTLRWPLEILHGFLTVSVFLGLSQTLSVERLLFNSLAVLIFVTTLVVFGQTYER